MPTHTLPAVRHCSLRDLDAFPELFLDYCTAFDRVASYYNGDWHNADVRRKAADTAAARPADRDRLADVLRAQNERWNAGPATLRNIDALRDPDAVAVVTGQQVGLFSGPLYTIYKTITTLQLAREWADELGRPVVPVFWVAGEDHDFDEIAGTSVLHRNEPVALRYDGHTMPDDGNLGPVGRLDLTPAIDDVVEQLDEALPPSEFKPDLMARVREAYAPGTTLRDAFVTLMQSFFADDGLVFVSSDDPEVKAMGRSLFRRELEDPETSSQHVLDAGDTLEDAGYHAQVHARATNLFWLDDGERLPLDWAGDDTFVLRGTDRTFRRDDLLAHLDASPERFSPNVVLRPLLQDTILPTVAYVGGPGEVSYFAQYKNVYDWADVAMPLIVPRASVSLVESKVQKVLDKFDLTICQFGGDFEQLFQQTVVREMDVDVEAVFGDAMTEMHKAINALKPDVEAVDRTLGSSAESTRAAVVQAMNELKHKVVRAEKRQHEEMRSQLEKARANLRPGGTLQERVLSVLYFLNKYSPSLLPALQDALSPTTDAHQVVEV